MNRKDQPAWKDVMSRQGLDDMTLLSKITNEEISKNLKERFDEGIIYVRLALTLSLSLALTRACVRVCADGMWPFVCIDDRPTLATCSCR